MRHTIFSGLRANTVVSCWHSSAVTARIAFLLASVLCVQALVDPKLQPIDLVARHQHVVAASVSAIDDSKREATFAISRVIAGTITLSNMVLEMPLPDPASGRDDLLKKLYLGDQAVGLLAKMRARQGREGLLYHGHEWHEIVATDDTLTRWTWVRGLGDSLHGTFDGDAGQLATLFADGIAGRPFFPAVPFTRFQSERVLGTVNGDPRGVALADVDGDGRLDVYAASTAGGRLWRQHTPLTFSDDTAAAGLAGINARSVSVADADGDGHQDLLLDGVLWRGDGGRFTVTTHLPLRAGAAVHVAAFVELDGDGRPDVLVSYVDGGLGAYRNAGNGAAFSDITARVGLDRPECGAGKTGFFAPGDWNGDGRCDVFLSVGPGLLLVQDGAGIFKPQVHRLGCSFRSDDGVGLTGAGCMAPLWRGDSVDLAIPLDTGLVLSSNRAERIENVAGWGNESQLSRSAQIATLAEDLNLDGNVDLFTITRRRDGRNILHTNRGYGSYMVDDLYAKHELMPGKAYDTGAWGIAAGDVDGDGAPDLVMTSLDGQVRLLLNDVLTHRPAGEDALTQARTLAQTGIVAVAARGPGALGATLTLVDAAGRRVAQRQLGIQVLTGCAAPLAVSLATREPGAYRLMVRFANGVERTWPVTIAPATVTRLAISASAVP